MPKVRIALAGTALFGALAGAASDAAAQVSEARFAVRATVHATCRMSTADVLMRARAPADDPSPAATVACTNRGRWTVSTARREIAAAGRRVLLVTVEY